MWCRGANPSQVIYSPVEGPSWGEGFGWEVGGVVCLLFRAQWSAEHNDPETAGPPGARSPPASAHPPPRKQRERQTFYPWPYCFSLNPPPLPHPPTHTQLVPAIHPQPPYDPGLRDKKPIERAAKAGSSERDNWRRRLKQQCAQPHWVTASVELVDVHAYVWKSVYAGCQGSLKRICLDPSKGTPVHFPGYPNNEAFVWFQLELWV